MIVTKCLFGQSAEVTWAISNQGATLDYATDLSIDHQGNVIICGNFAGTNDFDPGGGSLLLSSTGSTDMDFFVQKLDSLGNLMWAVKFGGTGIDPAVKMDVDTEGNIYVTGWYNGNISIVTNSGIENFTSNGFKDVYIMKLNSDGEVVWARSFDHSATYEMNCLCVDHQGCVYLAGHFNGTIDLNPNAGADYYSSTSGLIQAFVTKIDSSGNYLWTNHFDSYLSKVNTMYYSSGQLIVAGNFEGSITFPVGAGLNSHNTTTKAMFVYSMDENASGNWVKYIEGNAQNSSVYSKAMALDSDDNIILVGAFMDTIDFDPSSLINLQDGTLLMRRFVLKLDPYGDFEWVKVKNVLDYTSTATLPSGKILNIGILDDTVNIDVDSSQFLVMPPSSVWGSGTMRVHFLECLSPDGHLLWAKVFESQVGQHESAIETDSNNNVYFAASQNTDLYINSSTLTDTLFCNEGDNSFVIRLDSVCTSETQEVVNTCEQFYLWSDGIAYYSDNYSAIQHTTNIFGCDSTVTLKLTFHEPNLSITGQDTLWADANALSYQWIDCSSMLPIAGQTNQFFVPTMSGDYAVTLEYRGCTETTGCVSYVSVNDKLNENSISVYPNPANDYVLVKQRKQMFGKYIDLKIYSMTGETVLSMTQEGSQDIYKLQLNNIEAGIYTLYMKCLDQELYRKLIVIK